MSKSWIETCSSRPFSNKRAKEMTKERFQRRIEKIIDHVDIDSDFFAGLTDSPDWKPYQKKWKTYVYLKKCILDYREKLPHEELTLIINFLEANSENKKWLANQLVDPSERLEDERWGAGNHEWLERSLIIDVLKRSAGMVEGVEHTKELGCIWGEIDWLDVQACCRTSTKYIFFKKLTTEDLPKQHIFSGHPGAVKRTLFGKGFAQQGSGKFHQGLIQDFKTSKTLLEFIKHLINTYRRWLLSGRKKLNAANEKRYVIDGTSNTDIENLETFRKNKLKPAYLYMKRMFEDLYMLTSENGEADENSIVFTDSDSSDEENLTHELAVLRV